MQRSKAEPQMFFPKSEPEPESEPVVVVSVVAYRDRQELVRTVESILGNASKPGRVMVYLFSQDTYANNALLRLSLGRIRGVFLLTTHYLNARGPLWARQKLLKEIILPRCCGTEHYLQLDSHMRLVRGWDEALLRNFSNIYGDSNKIITHYPPPYRATTKVPIYVPMLTGTEKVVIGGNTIRKCVSRMSFTGSQIATGCLQSPHVAAGFFFSTIRDVYRSYPLGRYYEYVFQGEEMLLETAFRRFRKYPPDQNIALHVYGRRDSPKVWSDLPAWTDKNREALARLLLDLDKADHFDNATVT